MGFYERIRREVRDRGSFSIPCSLSDPCHYCQTYRSWMSEIQEPVRIQQLKLECMRTCDKVRYYDRFGINPFYDPMTAECEYLILWVNELMAKRDAGGDLSTDELEQLRVWGARLGLVLAMEEAKVAAAASALESIREATEGL